MPLYDYRCTQGHLWEAIRPMTIETLVCGCGEAARRVAANRIDVVGPTTDTRGMFRRFTEASQEMDYTASRQEASTGQPARTPPYWQMAKARAKALIEAGENPVGERKR